MSNKHLEIIKLTELLLNALNQGDYDTYTRLCDPHMTSFEPENMGNLIDNMEYRRLCIDQARQLQIHHHIQRQTASQSQVAATSQRQQAIAVAATAAAAAAAAAATAAACEMPTMPNTPTSKQQLEQQRQRVQQSATVAATAAAQSALANLSLIGNNSNNSSLTPTTNSTTTNEGVQELNYLQLQQQQQAARSSCASTLKQYSLIVNPSVYQLGEDAATIAYTKLSHMINLATGQLCSLEQSEETRVWHKRDGKSWTCVHLHRSLGSSANNLSAYGQLGGPQTSLSLLRSVAHQQQLANLVALQHNNNALVAQQQHQPSVPLISLNSNQTSHQQQSSQR